MEKRTQYGVMHFGLLILALALFTQLSIDAIILGALLIYLIQRKKI